MPSPAIFITGATGYLGGSVFSKLLTVVDPSTITALVRSEDKADKLKSFGVKTILGNYSDLELLTDTASKADIILTFADADNVSAAEAILAGMEKKHSMDGTVPALIHTSGTGILTDNALGMCTTPDSEAVSDLDVKYLESIPETTTHRPVDLRILEADKKGFMSSYLVFPSTVYGLAAGVLAETGVQNIHSVQLPPVVKTSLHRKQGGMIGDGLNVWSCVSLPDTVDFYILLLNKVINDPATEHGATGYYFLESSKYVSKEVATEISKVLVELGVGSSPEPSTYGDEEKVAYFGHLWPYLGTNSLAKGDRSRALGWTPKDGKTEFLASLKQEILSHIPK